MHKSSRGQQWDFMITTYRKGQHDGEDTPFIIFVDFKSSGVATPLATDNSSATMYKQERANWSPSMDDGSTIDTTCKQTRWGGNVKQYQKVKGLQQYLSKNVDNRYIMTPLSQALVDGNYVYVYLTTYEEVDSEESYYHDIVEGTLAITNRADTKKFFGILFPFYDCARSAII